MLKMSDSQPIGSRGVYFSLNNGTLDLRKFLVDVYDKEKRVATAVGVSLSPQETSDMKAMIVGVNAEITTAINNDESPNFFQPIGHDGMYVNVSRYEGHLLVQIRKYFRPIQRPESLLPTKKGIALKIDEWQQMVEKI